MRGAGRSLNYAPPLAVVLLAAPYSWYRSYPKLSRNMGPTVLDAPSIACVVLQSFADPFPAHKGELLIIWPGHPRHTIASCSADGTTFLRSRPYEDGKLYGDLLHLFLDAKIRCLTEQAERALLRVG